MLAPLCSGLKTRTRIRLMLRILDFQHGVRPFGNRRTGHDADRLAWADRLSRHLAGRHILNHRQGHRFLNRVLLLDVLPTHRESVHGAIIPRRIVAFDDDVFAEHASQAHPAAESFPSPAQGWHPRRSFELPREASSRPWHPWLSSLRSTGVGGEPRSRATRSSCRTLPPYWRSRDTPRPLVYQN